MCWDSNPRLLEYKSPLITTRPDPIKILQSNFYAMLLFNHLNWLKILST